MEEQAPTVKRRGLLKGCVWPGVLIGVTTLLLTELGARALLWDKPLLAPYIMRDAELLFRLKPHWTGSIGFFPRPGEAAAFQVALNSDGLRAAVPREKAPGEFRILLLGDSYTFGWGLEYPQTYAHKLEAALRARYPHRTVRVLNGGIGAYGPWQELVLLRRVLLGYQPDLVLLQTFVNNDASDSLTQIGKRFPAYYREREVGMRELQLANEFWEYRLHRWMRREVASYRLLNRRLGESPLIMVLKASTLARSMPSLRLPPSEPGSPIHEVDRKDWGRVVEQGWNMMLRDILAIRDTSLEAGTAFGVFNVPCPVNAAEAETYFASVAPHFEYELDKGTRLIEQFYREEGIPHFSLLQAFREHPDPASLWFSGDGHVTEAGADLIAREMLRFLEAEPELFPVAGDLNPVSPEI